MSESRLQPRRSRGLGWLVAGAIALVAGVALIVSQQLGSTTGAGPSPSPSPQLSAHEVATDQGIVSFALENGAIVVRLEAGGTTTELGRTSTATGGSSGFAMVCGPADGPTSHRYVFGHLDGDATIEYTGPPAVGQGAPDGIFLFALRPGTVGTAQMIQVEAGSGPGNPMVRFPGTVFADAIATGQRQASGCYVEG
jgi:hypothetical protein